MKSRLINVMQTIDSAICAKKKYNETHYSKNKHFTGGKLRILNFRVVKTCQPFVKRLH